MKDIEHIFEEIQIPKLSHKIGAKNGIKTIISFTGIAHIVKSNIHPKFLEKVSPPSPYTEIRTFKIPKGGVLPNMFDSIQADYEKLQLTQHQILDYILSNCDSVKSKIHSLYFIAKIAGVGHCLFCVVISDQENKLLFGILPVEQANTPIKSDLAVFVAPKR